MNRSLLWRCGAALAGAVLPLGSASVASADPPALSATLTASDGSGGAGFGDAMAVSGDTIVVGAPQAGSGGAIYVFVRGAGGWKDATETAKLTALDAGSGDRLGSSVAIDGDTIVAGAPGASGGRGAAYVFVRPAEGWQTGAQRIQLAASDGAAGDRLGSSVGISGRTVVAGAPGARVGSNGGQGAVYAFTEGIGGWQSATETAKLIASDGKAFDAFGSFAAVSGDTAVAAGGGAEYVFGEPSTGWSSGPQSAKLTAATRLGAVAIDGGVIAAGATNAAGGAGAVEIYLRSLEPGVGWVNAAVPDAELTASDGIAGAGLGTTVALSGTMIASGIAGGGNVGAVYTFIERPSGWASGREAAKLSAPGGGSFEDSFGQAVGVDGSNVESTAPTGSGAAYVYGQRPPPPSTSSDPTTPPRYTPAPGTLAAGGAGRPSAFSANVTSIGSLLLVNPGTHRLKAELLCAARPTTRCRLHGVLFVLIGHRRTVLGTFSPAIAGSRTTVVSVHVRLPSAHVGAGPLPATLILTSSAPGFGHVTSTVPVIVRLLAPGKPPTVTTEPASGIFPPDLAPPGAPAAATLAGTINPNGKATRYHFELGLGAGAYDFSAPMAGAVAGSDQLTHLVTAPVALLAGGFTYHYRLVAQNASGTTYGADHTFTVPLTSPPWLGVPLGDSTIAGPVALVLTYSCFGDPPPIVTGATVTCVVGATNVQPPVVSLGGTLIPVRAASVVLDAVAPPGTFATDTRGANAPIALQIPAGASTTATARFTVAHPGPSMSFEILQAGGPAAISTLAPAEPRVRLSVDCSRPRGKAKGARPRSISCTVTSTNAGQDSADFTRLDIAPSAALTGARTTAGRPPAVLAAGGSAQMTVQFDMAPDSTSGGVVVTASGHDETDRLPFSVSSSANVPPAGGTR